MFLYLYSTSKIFVGSSHVIKRYYPVKYYILFRHPSSDNEILNLCSVFSFSQTITLFFPLSCTVWYKLFKSCIKWYFCSNHYEKYLRCFYVVRLTGLSVLWCGLVEQMISAEPTLRPPASVILHHPALWDKARVLTFLQVSD